MSRVLAPICVFTYCRLDETKQTIKALRNNYLSKESVLIIFSDGAKDEESWVKVIAVREYLKTINGFLSVEIIESPINIGLANSIIEGVSKVISKYGKVIVLEDDLITSQNFLDYMNQALEFYESYSQVISISGFSFSNCLTDTYEFDATFGFRASSWGWATWANKWNKVDWSVSDYSKFRFNPLMRIKFNKGGSDLSYMLDKQMKGKINSWAIRFCYHQFKYNLVDVYPKLSKIRNIGFGKDAENCDFKLFEEILDESEIRCFKFSSNVYVDSLINKEFRKNHSYVKRINRFIRRKLGIKIY